MGIAAGIPDDAIAYTRHYLDPMPQDRIRQPSGSFGSELPPPADATPTEVLMAWTGRATR